MLKSTSFRYMIRIDKWSKYHKRPAPPVSTKSLRKKIQSGDTDLERFLVYLCIGVKLLILDTLSTYTYEIDLKNLHLNTPFLLVLNNSMRGGVNNFMPFRKQRLSKCCIFGDIFSKYMNLSIFVLRLI